LGAKLNKYFIILT